MRYLYQCGFLPSTRTVQTDKLRSRCCRTLLAACCRCCPDTVKMADQLDASGGGSGGDSRGGGGSATLSSDKHLALCTMLMEWWKAGPLSVRWQM